MKRKTIIGYGAGLCLFLAAAWLFLPGCGGEPADPIQELRQTLQGVPTYSIVLDDMNEEGNFFKKYFQKYQIVTPEKTTKTDWKGVSQKVYERYLPLLGMTVFSKKDGEETTAAGPPGYQYVGDDRYGRWEKDSSGNSFWVFLGQYALLSHLLGGGPIYRRDYDNYRTSRSQGRPYYGPNKEYGTTGTITKKQKPDFYSRRVTKQRNSSTSFGSKVNKRIGRTRTGTRGRSSSSGK